MIVFYPIIRSLITSQTFLPRVLKDISYNISTGKWKLKWGLNKRTYEHLNNNENIIRAVKERASEKTNNPKFVYAHLMMPHYPYYFDSQNRPLPIEKFCPARKRIRKIILNTCSIAIPGSLTWLTILSQIRIVLLLLCSSVIMASGQGTKKEEHRYAFMNLNAIYLPEKNYSGFYDNISNVNQFRVLLNKEFEQHLSLLKDSTIFLWGD